MAEIQQEILAEIYNLLESEDLYGLSSLLKTLRSSDLAEVVEILDEEETRIVFNILDKQTAAEVFEKVDEATRHELFDLFSKKELIELVSSLHPDDAVDVLSEMEDDEQKTVLRSLPPVEAAKIKSLMKYSEDSAGGIMDPILISVQEDATVAEAIAKIRASELGEDFFHVYVVDKHGKYVGYVRLRHLLTSPDTNRIRDLVISSRLAVTVDTDQEEVRNIFKKNDLIVLPVLDENNILVGRITADRVIEVAQEEAVEDMYAMAGTDPAELESFSAIHAAWVRMTWLIPCLIGTGVTAIVLMFFESHEPVVYVTAVAFVPMIAAISGNAGLQTSAIVVTGLATGDLAALSVQQVFSREFRIAVVVALSCGFVGALLSAVIALLLNYFYPQATEIINPANLASFKIIMALGIAMFSAIMVATTLGLFLPFVFKQVGIDPAISSGPLVTTANDSISVAIYMSLAVLLAT